MKNDLMILGSGMAGGVVFEDNQAVISAIVTIVTWLITKIFDRYAKRK